MKIRQIAAPAPALRIFVRAADGQVDYVCDDTGRRSRFMRPEAMMVKARADDFYFVVHPKSTWVVGIVFAPDDASSGWSSASAGPGGGALRGIWIKTTAVRHLPQ